MGKKISLYWEDGTPKELADIFTRQVSFEDRNMSNGLFSSTFKCSSDDKKRHRITVDRCGKITVHNHDMTEIKGELVLGHMAPKPNTNPYNIHPSKKPKNLFTGCDCAGFFHRLTNPNCCATKKHMPDNLEAYSLNKTIIGGNRHIKRIISNRTSVPKVFTFERNGRKDDAWRQEEFERLCYFISDEISQRGYKHKMILGKVNTYGGYHFCHAYIQFTARKKASGTRLDINFKMSKDPVLEDYSNVDGEFVQYERDRNLFAPGGAYINFANFTLSSTKFKHVYGSPVYGTNIGHNVLDISYLIDMVESYHLNIIEKLASTPDLRKENLKTCNLLKEQSKPTSLGFRRIKSVDANRAIKMELVMEFPNAKFAKFFTDRIAKLEKDMLKYDFLNKRIKK